MIRRMDVYRTQFLFYLIGYVCMIHVADADVFSETVSVGSGLATSAKGKVYNL